MVEKAKRRTMPLLLTIMIAALLAVSGIGILGINTAVANATTVPSVSNETDGMEEEVEGSAAYTSPSGTNNKNQKYWNFAYTGRVQSLTGLPIGNYKLEVWGAQGGDQPSGSGGYIQAGRGGYSVGVYNNTTASATLYVVVGGAGGRITTSSAPSGGGYNGGGSCKSANGTTGGGATHIATATGLLSALSSNKSEVKIVAGGGGGGGWDTSNQLLGYAGGATGGAGGRNGGWSNYCIAYGGSQTRGGTYDMGSSGVGGYGVPTEGSFGQGGSGRGWSSAGAGGGGGYYGGSGCNINGGGGGSGYIGGVTSNTTLGVTANTISGNAAMPITTINSTTTEVGHSGNGYARITQLNAPITQSSIPTIALNRTTTKTITIANLNLTDTDTNEVPIFKRNGIYMSASTTGALANSISGNNYWISYKISNINNASATQITNVKALRYWSGTKRFYVNITDRNTSTGALPGADVWASFYATCDQGSVTPVATSAGANAARKYGLSTVTTPATANNANAIYNPLGANRRTVYLRDPVANTPVSISASQLYTYAAGSAGSGNEALLLSSAVTYGTNRYNKDSGTASAIAGSPANSSQYTNVTFGGATSGTYYNGSGTSSVTAGYTSLSISAKTGVASGPYYYVMTVKVQLIDLKSNVVETVSGATASTASYDIDIVYRVDNTRPVLKNPPPNVLLAPGQTSSLPISSICTDPDGNNLTISDVVVPSNEYVGVDQYGNVKTTAASPALAYYNVGAAASYTSTSDVVTKNAQGGSATGFPASAIYKMSASGANSSFTSSQAQGTVDSAYAGYYVNTANNTLYLVGNKASRDLYPSGRASKLGHFYILVRITDSGNPNDAGIWYPVAITVSSASPVAAGYPSVNGNAGEEFYFTPLGVLNSDGATYYGVGTYKENENEVGGTTYSDAIAKNGIGTSGSNKKAVLPFVYDPDNYVYTNDESRWATSYGGVNFDSLVNGNDATYHQRSMAFITPNSLSAANNTLFASYNTQSSASPGIDMGFKEFYTVKTVELYASTSILRGLTSDQVAYLVTNGFISIDNTTNSSHSLVRYKGIKVTLNRHTMSRYVSFYVDVTDTDKSTSRIRIAVNVQNTPMSASSVRSNLAESKKNFNTNVYATTRNGSAFEYTLKVGDVVNITPYDLFYDSDTFAVNNGKVQNIAAADYNTYVGAAGHSDMLAGINKTIPVYASATADGAVSQTNLSLEKFRISNTTPQIFGGDNYAKRTHVPEGNGVAEHFKIEGLQRTPVSGYVSFNYVISTTAGDAYTVEIRIIVANSLPQIRPEILLENDNPDKDLLPFRLTASTDLTYVNSSEAEKDTGNGYYQIDTNSYNIREFTLNDLFIDYDGDAIMFYNAAAGIKVGTHDVYGNFIPFDDSNYGNVRNVYLNAYVGVGTNIRLGKSNCLILQGLSSTQGLPGGLWIQFDIIDNAVGSTTPVTMEFQVEVYNSAPKYADLSSGTNSLTNQAFKPDGVTPDTDNPKYLWQEESETTGVIVAKALTATTNADLTVHLPNAENNAAATVVNKPVYIASGKEAMEAYKETVNAALVKLSVNSTYNYSDSQVRYIAADVDNGQGLALWGGAYYGAGSTNLTPGFHLVDSLTNYSFDRESNAAVVVTPMYGSETKQYYVDNSVVQIVSFKEDGGKLVMTTDPNEANASTNWVIAFNFTTLPDAFDVRIRLRDSNNPVALPVDGSAANQIEYGTQGGFTYFKSANDAIYQPNAYSGKRTIATDSTGKLGFVPNAVVSNLYNGDGVFGVTISKRPQGLYNNFTKWSGSVTLHDEVYNNVWALEGDGGNYITYDSIQSGFDQNDNYGVFQYTGIDVPTGANGVSVPISYFAWPAEIASSSERGTAQKVFAWYDIPLFPKKAGTSGSVAVQNSEFDAISLSDGYTTWSGANLNKNPYVTFRSIYDNPTAVNNNNNEFNAYFNKTKVQSGNYLYAQQRFAITTDSSNNVSVSALPVLDTGSLKDSCFFEDTYGLNITKRAMRSVGELTLTLRFATWQFSSGAYSKVVNSQTNEYDVITVTVPLTVANTALTMIDNSIDVNTNTSKSGENVVLTTNHGKDSQSISDALFIRSNPTDDQWVESSGLYNPQGYEYRENMYFLSSSIMGAYSITEPNLGQDNYKQTLADFRMSEDELNTIKAFAASTNPDANRLQRLLDYFGMNNADSLKSAGLSDDDVRKYLNMGFAERIACLQIKDGEVKLPEMGADDHLYVNPYYSNYFTVSPSATDSTQIAIIPNRITTFDYSAYNDRAAIEAAAAERNLKVLFAASSGTAVSKIYYPLQLIVYDRLSVGYAGNTTTFENSSFDVVTINVCVENSAPSLTNMFTTSIRPTTDATALYGRTVSLSKDSSIYYSFTDLINDGNMITENYNYLTKAQVEAKGGIAKDTGDYLKQITNSSGKPLDITGKAEGEAGYSATKPLLVGIEFMTLVDASGKTIGTNEYTGSGSRGAVECEPSSTGIRIYVRNRAQNLNGLDNAAAYIKLTFTDRFDKTVSCYIAVKISNAAPELTSNAIAVREITMKTGQYFTLYTTEYSQLIQGAGVSETVGESSGSSYNGKYFTQTNDGSDSNSKNLGTLGNRNRVSWTLQDGVANNSHYQGLPNIKIGQDAYTAGNDAADSSNNLGYMAVATDDAAWTLRIPRSNGYTSSVSSSIISITELNMVSYEGSSIMGCTALMFEAKGATTGATITVTVFDGVNDGLNSDVQSVTYTFKIIVESTKPIGIDNQAVSEGHAFASNVRAQNPQHPEMADRISIDNGSSDKTYIYNLRMYAGESIKLLTSDFAYDIDSGDTAIMYLLPRSGDNPFTIKDKSTGGTATNTLNSTYIRLTHNNNNSAQTSKSIAFTVTALNFQNGENDDKLYSEIEFYICDPHSSNISDAILITLRVYIYPSEVKANADTKVRTIEVNGVTSEDAIKTVKLVTSTDAEGGLFVDNDAYLDNTRYSVTVYSLAHYKTEGGSFVMGDDGKPVIESYTENEFNGLGDKSEFIIAKFTITSNEVNGVDVFSGSGLAFDKSLVTTPSDSLYFHYQVVNQYISDISFSANGTEMYLTPAKATSAARLISGSQDTGFRLGVKVEKYVSRDGSNVGYYPDKNEATPPAYSSEVITKVSVSNSAPEAVGNKDENMGEHINSSKENADANRAYLSMIGVRGDYWIYYLYNFAEPDIALFTDPDGDTIDLVDEELVGLYTYELDDNGRATRVDHFADGSAYESAKDAYTLTKETQNVVYPYGSATSTDAYPAIRVTVQHKVVIPGITGRTVYLEIRVRGKDPYTSKYAETMLTLAIDNSAPMFKAQSADDEIGNEGVIDGKYNDSTLGTSYEHTVGSPDASLTLTLNKDNGANIMSTDGELRIPLMDLIGDIDYDSTSGNNELFSYVSTGLNNVADLALINGDSSKVLWISGGTYGVVSDSSDASSRRFTVQLLRDNNLTLVVKINSYERGERESFVFKVRDRDGEETGTLTVTLIIGNSAPIDKTHFPDGDPDKANPNIILAGGKTGTNSNGTFDSHTYSILDYVTDNNPDDKKAFDTEPSVAANYLRIISITPGSVYLDDGTLYVPDSSGKGGEGDDSATEANLVQISTDNTQKFSITPIAGMYGTQTLTFRISDGGNRYSSDTEYISINIMIQITKNPDDMDIYDFSVHWRRTKEFTAKDLFDNPETVSVDESSGLLIKKVELIGNSPYVSMVADNANYKFSVEALTKNGGAAIPARVTVVVGNEITDSATEYVEEFNIFILDNLKPYFRTDPNSGESYGDITTLFYKGDIDDDGICEVPVTFFFDDAEDHDEIRLVSASSIKSTIIGVSVDASRNVFVFQFKSQGDTTIKCQVRDAVATYDYTFKVGNADLPAPNFFIGIISRMQENPLIFIIIGAGILLFLLILILIIAAVRKKKKMRAEIEALLVSEMELEEQMLKLAAGSTSYMNNAYGYLPPTPGAAAQPGLMLGSGTGAPATGTGAIGLNPGGQQNPAPQNNNAQLPPADTGFNDDDL